MLLIMEGVQETGLFPLLDTLLAQTVHFRLIVSILWKSSPNSLQIFTDSPLTMATQEYVAWKVEALV